jgi:hypothetical protein
MWVTELIAREHHPSRFVVRDTSAFRSQNYPVVSARPLITK